jgi:hypothetical protein
MLAASELRSMAMLADGANFNGLRRRTIRGRQFNGRGIAELEGNVAMWRSFFLAIGAYCCLLGVEALAVEKAVIKVDPDALGQSAGYRDVIPPDWAPWSMLGGGAVVMLYSFTIPQRVHGGG